MISYVKGKKKADGPYIPRGLGKGRVLNEATLRKNIGRDGDGGEAHHIIPDNVVQGLIAAEVVPDANGFDDGWNGILLHGSNSGRQNPITNGAAPKIFHRKNGVFGHDDYDDEVTEKLSETDDLKELASDIKGKIETSSGFLDDLSI